MNYELAKELKDAGFPFRNHYLDQECCEPREDIDGELLILPTLSELIEAVPGDAFLLWKDTKGWHASSSEGSSNEDDQRGSTPEEAVARLWLALNKKEV